MGSEGFRTIAADEPRLAPYAAGRLPAWLWSADGSRILWCNALGAAALGLRAQGQLMERSPADPHRRQVNQIAARLSSSGATRMQRLRGFGARLGQLMTCACSRFDLQDGGTAVLVVAMEPVGRTPPPAATTSDANDVIPGEAAIDQAIAGPIFPPAIDADRSDSDGPAEPSSTGVAESGGRAEFLPAPPGRAPDVSGTPLRFVWQIDAMGNFSLISEEFLRIAGERTAAIQGRPWTEIARALALDPQGRITQAIADRETFSGAALQWPLADRGGARIELSGMPVYDSRREFAGYRGFGIYRHTIPQAGAREPEAPHIEQPASNLSHPSTSAAAAAAPDSPTQAETETVEPPQNVVPFPGNEPRGPSLSAVENHAFDEIARRLTHQIEKRDREAAQPHPAPETPGQVEDRAEREQAQAEQPAWLAEAAKPPRGESSRDRMLLDLIPSGILIYRLDRLLYANRAFLDASGFDNLHALQEAGGLDALYVEPGTAAASSASDAGMPLKIAPGDRPPSAARLFSILWDGESAHALILQGSQAAPPVAQAAPSLPAPAPPDDTAADAILDAVSDGIVRFDRSGAIVSSNPGAEALFGLTGAEFQAVNFADLFAAESQRTVLDDFESLDGPIRSAAHDTPREVLGRKRTGGFAPLSMIMGRAGGERFFAVFRDLSQLKRHESELFGARRAAERSAAARSEALARASHDIRGPLNTIAGFANLMIEQRLGAGTSERHAEYLKDIRSSAERAIAILDDIANVSSIETGKHDLKLVSQNLNEMVESCVGALQPQANRERVIIRTSLAHALPQVMADTQALRQITMNIVTSSIRFSNAGGQVIVSTAPGDNGGAILRVRDSGRGLTDSELAAAMGRAGAPAERLTADRGAIDLSLARALAEANRAHFQIRTTENAGTLIEVAFANVRALAG